MKRILVGLVVLGALFAFFTVPINGDTAFNYVAKRLKHNGSPSATETGGRVSAMAPLMAPAAQKETPMDTVSEEDEKGLDDLIQARTR